LLLVALAACGGSTQQSEDPATEATEEPTAIAQATETTAPPTSAPAEEGDDELLSVPVDAVECEAVEIPTNTQVAGPSDDDWAKGPATAPVTVVEYGDFQ
jgi:hypothetical protein